MDRPAIGVDLDIVGWILIQPIQYRREVHLLDNGEQRGLAMSASEEFDSELTGNTPAPGGEMELHLDLDGFEGPIDVLLTLARDQKVDLAKISILELADQYLAFIERARRLRLEIAADYLVMAAWLAYLKSRLLLPEPPADGEPSGAELAAALAFQLQRLEAMQQAGRELMARPQFGRDFFGRGAPEPVQIIERRSTSCRSTTCSRPMATIRAAATRACCKSRRWTCTRWTMRCSASARCWARCWTGPRCSLPAAGIAARPAAPRGAGRDLRGQPGAGPHRPARAAPGQQFGPIFMRRGNGNLAASETDEHRRTAMTDDRFQLLRLLEAILFAAAEPVAEEALAGRLPEGADITACCRS